MFLLLWLHNGSTYPIHPVIQVLLHLY